jgi:hypothetical protein
VTDPTSSQAMFEMFQKMANPFAFPLQNFLTPSLSIEEVEKKIAELKSVQGWLQTNLGMLELSIKSLEYQKVLLSPGTAEQENPSQPDNPFLDPKNWPWNFLKSEEAAPTEHATAKPHKKKSAPK